MRQASPQVPCASARRCWPYLALCAGADTPVGVGVLLHQSPLVLSLLHLGGQVIAARTVRAVRRAVHRCRPHRGRLAGRLCRNTSAIGAQVRIGGQWGLLAGGGGVFCYSLIFLWSFKTLFILMKPGAQSSGEAVCCVCGTTNFILKFHWSERNAD